MAHTGPIVLGMMVLAAMIHARPAHGDGGLLRLSARSGPYQVTVFTSPTPLRAGPADFSVLLQDATTRAVLPDARIVFRTTSAKGTRATVDHVATSRATTNRLLKAAQFELPSPGTWRVDVLVDGRLGRSDVGFPVEVSAAMPHWLDMAPWIALPIVPIGLFAVHEVLGRRNRRRRAISSETSLFRTRSVRRIWRIRERAICRLPTAGRTATTGPECDHSINWALTQRRLWATPFMRRGRL